MKRTIIVANSLLVAFVVGFASPSGAASDGEPVTTQCGGDLSDASQGEVCLAALSWRDAEVRAPVVPRSDDFLALAVNAVGQAAATGDLGVAEEFIAAVSPDYSDAEVQTLRDALQKPVPVPVMPNVGDDLTGVTSTEPRSAKTSSAETLTQAAASAAGDGIGSSRYDTYYADYNYIRSDGSIQVISTTRIEFWQHIAINSSAWGRKSLAFYLTKSSGRATYYGNVDCEIRHVDAFADSTVHHWPCGSPDVNVVNSFDMHTRKADYYGNRGDKYYNEAWFNINPDSATYVPLRGNREGHKWKNPDGGGAPWWL